MMPMGGSAPVHSQGSLPTNPASSNSLTPTGSSTKSSNLVSALFEVKIIYLYFYHIAY